MRHFNRFMSATSLCAFFAILALRCPAAEQSANELSDSEKSAGWVLLFDGKTTKGWHTFKKQTFPAKGWEVSGGWLHCTAEKGGEIVSDDRFDQFELSWDWKLAPNGNSGVKYFVSDTRNSALGHEYQMYYDPKTKDEPPGKQDTASFY